ncbi:MAG TPA: hypothetical protein VGR29_02280 [Thermomicrobiales bacterium]|nr:hypothetical protein [Thermomicrobiales bacterium]
MTIDAGTTALKIMQFGSDLHLQSTDCIPNSGGAIIGLTPEASPGELTRAALEGIATGTTVPARVSHRIRPDPGMVNRYHERYEIYLEALQAVTPISHRRASLGNHRP